MYESILKLLYERARVCVCMYVHAFERVFVYVDDVNECMYTYIHIKVYVHMMYTLMCVHKVCT